MILITLRQGARPRRRTGVVGRRGLSRPQLRAPRPRGPQLDTCAASATGQAGACALGGRALGGRALGGRAAIGTVAFAAQAANASGPAAPACETVRRSPPQPTRPLRTAHSVASISRDIAPQQQVPPARRSCAPAKDARSPLLLRLSQSYNLRLHTATACLEYYPSRVPPGSPDHLRSEIPCLVGDAFLLPPWCVVILRQCLLGRRGTGCAR